MADLVSAANGGLEESHHSEDSVDTLESEMPDIVKDSTSSTPSVSPTLA